MKTMRLLSADQWPSNCGLISLGKNGVGLVPQAFMLHRPILPLWMRVKRNFLPSGDHDRCWTKSPPNLETRTAGWSDRAGTINRGMRKAGVTGCAPVGAEFLIIVGD